MDITSDEQQNIRMYSVITNLKIMTYKLTVVYLATFVTNVIASSTWLFTFLDLYYKSVITPLICRTHAIPMRHPRNDILECLLSMLPAADIKYSGIKFTQPLLLVIE